MSNFLEKFKKEFDGIDKIKIFEIKIKDNNGEDAYLIFNIDIEESILSARGEFGVGIDITEGFSMDEHLQFLYESLVVDIIERGFELVEEE